MNVQSIDMLEDGTINSFDMIVLVDLVMSGGSQTLLKIDENNLAFSLCTRLYS